MESHPTKLRLIFERPVVEIAMAEKARDSSGMLARAATKRQYVAYPREDSTPSSELSSPQSASSRSSLQMRRETYRRTASAAARRLGTSIGEFMRGITAAAAAILRCRRNGARVREAIWSQQVVQILPIEIAIVKDLPEQSGAEFFPGMHWNDRGSSIGVTEEMVAPSRSHDDEAQAF